MTHLEINPSQWKELLDLKLKNDINKYRNTTIHASTDMYQCKKCKSKKCYYYELQIRGGDEASTIFVECSQCGKHWKEN
jgi:transcription elongation factor S-II